MCGKAASESLVSWRQRTSGFAYPNHSGTRVHPDLQGIDVPGGYAHVIDRMLGSDVGRNLPDGQADPDGGMDTTWNTSARRPSANPADDA